jgi:hypothetical protein
VYAQESVVVKIRDMGRGMELLPSPYRNDPEAVSLSSNMRSLQQGVATTRFGTTEFIDYNTSAILANAESVADLPLKGDSSAIIFAAGGNWYWSHYGKRVNGKMQFLSAPTTPRRIERYSPGNVSYNAGTVDLSFSMTKNTRHLLPGDTLVVEDNNDTFVVRYVVSDVIMVADSVNDITSTTTSDWHAWGSYNGENPYLYTSGDLCYTGDNQTPPQVIYSHNDTILSRPLLMVDSFYVDGILNFYVDSADGDQVRSSYEISNNDTVISEIQLVSRRAGWEINEWLQTATDQPVTYFVRIGWWQNNIKNKAKFFPIRGNSDTSMYLSAWYVSDTLGNTTLWRDSTLAGHGLRMQDTMRNSDMASSQWAYIYTATGFYDVVVSDEDTDTIQFYGRGAVLAITDTSTFYIDPDTFYTGMYYIHLTADDVEFNSYGVGTSVTHYNAYRSIYLGESPITQDQLPVTDTISSFWIRDIGWGRLEYWYTIRSTKPVFTIDAQYVNKSFYPVRYGEMSNDTLFIVTSSADFSMLADVSSVKTANWELVKIGMPEWSGISSWNNPEQLVAWGDTASPAVLSRAYPNDPWNWTALNDLIVGDPATPIVGATGYRDQILTFKDASMDGFNGSVWEEISLSDGLAGERAIAKKNDRVFWLDRGDLKTIARRDFTGLSVTTLSTALRPAFQAWTAGNYNADAVPFTVNPQAKHLSSLVYNPYDEHLYLFFPEGSSSANNKCLTFDLERNQWDGYWDLGVNDAFWMEFDDTMKVVCASSGSGFASDSALIFAIDNVHEDIANDATADIAVDAQRKSHKFWVTDQSGFPIEAKLKTVRILHRGDSDALGADSYFKIRSNYNVGGLLTAAHDSVAITLPGTQGDYTQFWRPSKDQTGTYWQYDLTINGVTTTPAPYSIYGIDLEFIPVGRDDNGKL